MREAPDGPRVLGTDPAFDEVDADRAAAVRVFFDRALAPDDVHRGTARLESGGRSPFLSPRFDPVDRVLLLVNAGEALDPGVVWRVEVEGIRDLDLHPMEPFSTYFRTGEDAVGDPPLEVPSFAEVMPIFERCAAMGCHVGPDPVLGLDLSSGPAIRATAIGIAAEETRVGVEGAQPWHGADALDGLARIDVVAGIGRPAQSYLVYKVLGDPHIGGSRMPPSPAAPLTHGELRALSDWILGGAPTD